MMQMLEPVQMATSDFALDEIEEVGPGGHFFGTERTMQTFETAFYRPLVSTTQNYGAWMEGGARTSTERATAVWQEAIRTFSAPSNDDSIREALHAFVARRRDRAALPSTEVSHV